MNSAKAIMLLTVAAVVVTTGCGYIDDPIELETIEIPMLHSPRRPVVVPAVADPTIANRFTSVDEQSLDADSAMKWSERYDDLSAKYMSLAEENIALTKERNELTKRMMALETDLKATKGELDDANLFLQDMHRELTKWKGDVLGFRDELRDADGAQLNALTKILKLLGAETTGPLAMGSANLTP